MLKVENGYSAHLLTVIKTNGILITEKYKLPKLSDLKRSKRNGQKISERDADIEEMPIRYCLRHTILMI